MKNKGFTLVEILGVMTLLGIIFALIYPNVMHMMDQAKQNEYEDYQDNIFLAAEAYVNANSELSSRLVAEGNQVIITYSDLLQNGYLSTKIVEPDSGKTVADLPTKTVTITVKNKKFVYSIQ